MLGKIKTRERSSNIRLSAADISLSACMCWGEREADAHHMPVLYIHLSIHPPLFSILLSPAGRMIQLPVQTVPKQLLHLKCANTQKVYSEKGVHVTWGGGGVTSLNTCKGNNDDYVDKARFSSSLSYYSHLSFHPSLILLFCSTHFTEV